MPWVPELGPVHWNSTTLELGQYAAIWLRASRQAAGSYVPNRQRVVFGIFVRRIFVSLGGWARWVARGRKLRP